jgi:hypothetical protein
MSLLRLTALNGNDLLIQSSAILYAERFSGAGEHRQPFTQISIKDHPPVRVMEDISDIVGLIGPEERVGVRAMMRPAAARVPDRIPA